jgi:hypothetical protein
MNHKEAKAWKNFLDIGFKEKHTMTLVDENSWVAQKEGYSIYIFDTELNKTAKTWFSEKLLFFYYDDMSEQNNHNFYFVFHWEDITIKIVIGKQDITKKYFFNAFTDKFGWLNTKTEDPLLVATVKKLCGEVEIVLRTKIHSERLPLLLGYTMERPELGGQ